jgi:hypothetical protein
MMIEDLLAQVLRLRRQERARVARELLSSLEEPEEQAAVAWAERGDVIAGRRRTAIDG